MRIRCERCECVVEKTGRNQKYCAECRAIVMREQQAEGKRRLRAQKKKEDLHTVDSEEMMAMCLSCTMPPSRCTGECIKVEALRAKRETL